MDELNGEALRFTEKVVVVTGGASGIGRAVTQRILGEGGHVVVADIRPGTVETDLQTSDTKGMISAISLDATDESSVKSAFADITESAGRIDVLVNGVGGPEKGTCVDTELETWDRVLRLNVTSAFLCSKYAIPVMQANGSGVIVNVASQSAVVGVPDRAAYGSAKAALLGLTRSITSDFAPQVRCNALSPGTTRTPLLDRAAASYEDPASFFEYIEQRQYIGRIAEASEMAAVVAFLASDDSSYMYGANVVVDGGMTASSPRQ